MNTRTTMSDAEQEILKALKLGDYQCSGSFSLRQWEFSLTGSSEIRPNDIDIVAERNRLSFDSQPHLNELYKNQDELGLTVEKSGSLLARITGPNINLEFIAVQKLPEHNVYIGNFNCISIHHLARAYQNNDECNEVHKEIAQRLAKMVREPQNKRPNGRISNISTRVALALFADDDDDENDKQQGTTPKGGSRLFEDVTNRLHPPPSPFDSESESLMPTRLFA